MMIPGRSLHRLASRVCSAKMLERVVEPAIADLQKEYSDVSAEAAFRRGWVLLRGYVSICRVLAAVGMRMMTPDAKDRPELVRTFVAAAIAIVVFTAIFVAVPAVSKFITPVHIALLIPQALPLAIPAGIVLGIAFGIGGRPVSNRAIGTIILAAFLCSTASFATLGWVMPAANQAYRQSIFESQGNRGMVMKGANEMALGELQRYVAKPASPQARSTHRHYAWSYHVRWALASAPLILAAFALAISPRRIAGRILIVLSCGLFLALLYTGEWLVTSSELPPFAGAWLPSFCFALATTTVWLKPDTTCRKRAYRQG